MVSPVSGTSPGGGAGDHRIRPVRPDDIDAIYSICLRTSDAGQGGTALHDDPRLPGHVWAGPYVAHQPEHGFVLVDPADDPIGYVLGASDSRRFEAELERVWWPPLRQHYPLEVDRPSSADRSTVRLIHHPPPQAVPAFVDDYPSHLHIDLLPEAQGRGAGRRLLEALFASLAAVGSPGVQLGVSLRNQGAIAFYRATGFTELGKNAHAMLFGRRLV